MRYPIIACIHLFLLATPALAQFDNNPFGITAKKNKNQFFDLADVSLTVDRPQAKWGETVVVTLTMITRDGGTTYPFSPKDKGQLSKNDLQLPAPGDLIFLPGTTDPTEGIHEKANPDGGLDQYYSGTVVWKFPAVVSPRATAGKKAISLGSGTRLQVCKDQCFSISGKDIPSAEIEIVDAASDKVQLPTLSTALEILLPQRGQSAAEKVSPQATNSTPFDKSSEPNRKTAKALGQYEAELSSIQSNLVSAESSEGSGGGDTQTGLWAFLATAAIWGLISLVTPCVFPMIPITVSIFLKQAHGSMGERLKLAGVYCLTIIVVLGVSAFALLKFMAWLSAHPVTNLLLAGLFFVLALSLFGMYEISLPNFMVRRLQTRQAKGGVLGTVFGALAFTIISFTCVAPFLGGFAGISAADSSGSLIALPTAREVLGGLVFATAFAAPFFVLALVPSLLRALPRSGGWLDSVKVVMGFLELAAALKFIRTAEVNTLPTTEYFTFDIVLAGWIAISLACGLYLLNLYRLPHDEEQPGIGVPRLIFASLFLGLAVYLLPAIFKTSDGQPQRPRGAVYAWIEAFLLPEGESDSTDLMEALERAKQSGKPVFIDFTGKSCTNCRFNEKNVFTSSDVKEEFRQFEIVKLYTDQVPAESYSSDPGLSVRVKEGSANREFQINAFGNSALPLYRVLMPTKDGKIVILGGYNAGKINSPSEFLEFLRDSRAKAKK